MEEQKNPAPEPVQTPKPTPTPKLPQIRTKLSNYGRACLKLMEFDEDEVLLSEIRKHPFGEFLIYFFGMIVAVFLFAIFVIGGSQLSGDTLGNNTSTIRTLSIFAGLVLTILVIVVTAISAYLYRTSVVLVTNEKVVQFLNVSLFNRKISQLSIGDVQDTTVSQVGIFPRLFNYGTLVIETAGEQINYVFTFTPDPFETSKTVVGAHEENLKEFGN